MSDLVERLRKWVVAVDAAPASDLMDQAASEIERLRLTDVERAAVEQAIETAGHVGLHDLKGKLRSLLERLGRSGLAD